MERSTRTIKLTRISPHIWQVRLGLFTHVHVWLVADNVGPTPGGLTLVDTGFPLMARDVLRAVELVDAGPLRRILLTHGHPDHGGGAALIAQEWQVPVYAHRLELPFLEGERRYPRITRLLQPARPGLASALPEQLDGTLESFGSLTPWSAPGHTPGHVVYHHEQDSVLLAGDLFKAHKGKLRQLGHFYSLDREQATRSEGIILNQLQPERLEASHGGSVLQPVRAFSTDLGPASD